jgi:Toxin SymE, type I toxin-antitoxin system
MRKATVTYSFRDNRSVPMIRLRGKWLEAAGFVEGRLIHVEVTEGILILTRVDRETSPDTSR